VLPPRNAVGRNRFSLATLASASSHGVGPLSEDITKSTQPVLARPPEAVQSLKALGGGWKADAAMIVGAGLAWDDSANTNTGADR
jgi:hypothetical protein